MNKLLITGAAGFVSRHLLNYLSGLNGYNVLGIDIPATMTHPLSSNLKLSYQSLNMLDNGPLIEAISNFKPDAIIHLASFSSVGLSWQFPVDSFRNNTNIFLNLVEAVRHSKIKCRILSVGSSEEYGRVRKKDLPLRENTVVNPVNPYAIARVSQEMLSKVYIEGYGLDIIMTRSFNHVGPGQNENFFIPSITRQIVEASLANPVIKVGNLDIIRDFVDVRDVVHAYMLLLEKGKTGELYNVCSGLGYSLREIVEKIVVLSGKTITVETESARIRPTDNLVIIGTNKKIKRETGWTPKTLLDYSLLDVYELAQKSL